MFCLIEFLRILLPPYIKLFTHGCDRFKIRWSCWWFMERSLWFCRYSAIHIGSPLFVNVYNFSPTLKLSNLHMLNKPVMPGFRLGFLSTSLWRCHEWKWGFPIALALLCLCTSPSLIQRCSNVFILSSADENFHINVVCSFVCRAACVSVH